MAFFPLGQRQVSYPQLTYRSAWGPETPQATEMQRRLYVVAKRGHRMRSILARSFVWGACFIAGLTVRGSPSVAANCALYARAETGVALYGAAGGWWDQAQGAL